MALQGTYRNDQRLLALEPISVGPAPQPLQQLRRQPVSLPAILRRRELRVGVRLESVPWVYRNRRQELVGFDLDLLRSLARTLGVSLRVREGRPAELEQWLQGEAVDLVMGGIQSSPLRAARFRATVAYRKLHLALVVPDEKVPLIQGLNQQNLGRPLRLAVSDPQLVTADLADQVRRLLGGERSEQALQIAPVASKEQVLSPRGRQQFDALLTTAEGGAAWAVLHPRFSLLTSFGDSLQSDLVILVAGDDEALIAYLNSWLAREQGRGKMERLFRYWVTLQDAPALRVP